MFEKLIPPVYRSQCEKYITKKEKGCGVPHSKHTMKVEICSRNAEVTPAIQSLIEKKAAKITSLVPADTEIRFMIDANKSRHKIEATVLLDSTIIRAEQRSDDLYKTIDQTVDVLVRRIKTYKEKKHEKARRAEDTIRKPAEEMAAEKDPAIVRRKSVKTPTITAEDAVEEMELLGHSFYVFVDADTDKTSVVYKREEAGYGLISIE